jgi:hypothetical protein
MGCFSVGLKKVHCTYKIEAFDCGALDDCVAQCTPNQKPLMDFKLITTLNYRYKAYMHFVIYQLIAHMSFDKWKSPILRYNLHRNHIQN